MGKESGMNWPGKDRAPRAWWRWGLMALLVISVGQEERERMRSEWQKLVDMRPGRPADVVGELGKGENEVEADQGEGRVVGVRVVVDAAELGKGVVAERSMPIIETDDEGVSRLGESVVFWEESWDDQGARVGLVVVSTEDKGAREVFVNAGAREWRMDISGLGLDGHPWDAEKMVLVYRWVGEGVLELEKLVVQAHSRVETYGVDELEFDQGRVVLYQDPKGAFFPSFRSCDNQVLVDNWLVQMGVGGCGQGRRVQLGFRPELNAGLGWEEVLDMEIVRRNLGEAEIDRYGCMYREDGRCVVNVEMKGED